MIDMLIDSFPSAGDGEQGREMRTLIQVDYQGNVTLLTQVGRPLRLLRVLHLFIMFLFWLYHDAIPGYLHDKVPDRRDPLPLRSTGQHTKCAQNNNLDCLAVLPQVCFVDD